MAQRSAGQRDPGRITSIEDRQPAQRLGVAVVSGLVDVIVSGELLPGDSLPPELPLSQQFGVSRTVLRESVKRLEEKGLVSVVQGRGTVVQPTRAWNMLDRIVLTSLIAHDDSLGVLDELSIVRARLEAVMAAEASQVRTGDDLDALRDAVETMRGATGNLLGFNAADARFHELVMSISGNRLAESIARALYQRALESQRFRGRSPKRFREDTVREHEAVLDAIEAGLADVAELAMNSHIVEAWKRRRPSDHGGSKTQSRRL